MRLVEVNAHSSSTLEGVGLAVLGCAGLHLAFFFSSAFRGGFTTGAGPL